LQLLRRRVIEPPLPCWSDFGDFGDPDFGEGERGFGEGERGFGEGERGFGEGERGFGDFAHSSASLTAFSFADADFADGFSKSITRLVLRLATLLPRYPLGSRRYIILCGGINPLITLRSNPRILAILICVSIFNMLQSHKFAVPSSQPFAKNLPLG
jgi:hypothetical protein